MMLKFTPMFCTIQVKCDIKYRSTDSVTSRMRTHRCVSHDPNTPHTMTPDWHPDIGLCVLKIFLMTKKNHILFNEQKHLLNILLIINFLAVSVTQFNSRYKFFSGLWIISSQIERQIFYLVKLKAGEQVFQELNMR